MPFEFKHPAVQEAVKPTTTPQVVSKEIKLFNKDVVASQNQGPRPKMRVKNIR